MTAASETPPRGHVQLPRSLLYSCAHSALAVWTWATYETLMRKRLGGRHHPVIAGRAFMAREAGASKTAIDDARRQLISPASGGPYLSRGAPRGCKRSVKHAALRRPKKAFAWVPCWTLNLVWAGRRRPDGRISAEEWRLYATCVDRAYRDGEAQAFDTTVQRLGDTLRTSAATARRRLGGLERAGLIEVTERPGGWFSLRVIVDADEVTAVAAAYVSGGRRRTQPHQSPVHIVALTPGKNRHSPLADSGTPLS